MVDCGGKGFEVVIDVDVCNWLWKVCYNVWYVVVGICIGVKGWLLDVCVLVLELVGVVWVVCDLLVDCLIFVVIFGYVGDGNFYVVFVLDVIDLVEIVVVKVINVGLVVYVIVVGGICIGEYGVGMGKIGYLVDEYDFVVL